MSGGAWHAPQALPSFKRRLACGALGRRGQGHAVSRRARLAHFGAHSRERLGRRGRGRGKGHLGGGQQRLHLCREQGPPSFSQKCAEQASPAPEGARGGSLVRCGQPRPSSLLGGAGRPCTACVFDRELYHPLHHVGAQVLVELPLEGLELDVVGVLAEGVGELCADVVDTWSSK